jgi:mono/diheme cytochrome c family protein
MLRTLAFTVGAGLVSVAIAAAQGRPTIVDPADPVARGAYLVTHVAMCVQCHSPRNDQGELDTSQLLQGARMPVASPYAAFMFAVSAPKLAGLPAGFHEDDLVKLLTTGRDHRGRVPRPPMPPFLMTEADARAVAAYLKTLR